MPPAALPGFKGPYAAVSPADRLGIYGRVLAFLLRLFQIDSDLLQASETAVDGK